MDEAGRRNGAATADRGISRRSVLSAASAAALTLGASKVQAASEAKRTSSQEQAGQGAVGVQTDGAWKIAFEEHFLTAALNPYAGGAGGLQPTVDRLLDVGEQRIQAMDEARIEYAILSLNSPGVQAEVAAARAINQAHEANDALKAIVDRYPRRLGGFAALPTQDAKQAAAELERCVREYGFHGGLINSFANAANAQGAVFLDDPSYDALWERAQALRVPIYLHPRDMNPNQRLIFEGRPELLSATWAFLVECSTHALRIITSGVFDRFPKLTICLGHLGEALPACQWRISETYRLKMPHSPLQRTITEYLQSNFVYTTSGFFDTRALRTVVDTVGLQRVCFSTDYPWMTMSDASRWFDAAPIGAAERLAIGRNNAIELFRLDALKVTTT